MINKKFKVYDLSQERYLDKGTYSFSFDEENNIKIVVDKKILKFGEYEIFQYIGLNDKNGKEIYENDILRLNNGKDEYGTILSDLLVNFHKGMFSVQTLYDFETIKDEHYTILGLEYIGNSWIIKNNTSMEDYEIVGNGKDKNYLIEKKKYFDNLDKLKKQKIVENDKTDKIEEENKNYVIYIDKETNKKHVIFQ